MLLFSCKISNEILEVLLCLEATSWPAHLVFDSIHILVYIQLSSGPGGLRLIFFCQGFYISGLYVLLHRVPVGIN